MSLSHARSASHNHDEPAAFSRSARLVVAAAVFILGLFIGAAVAAWIVPPS